MITEYKYNYIVLNYPDSKDFLKDNPDGYYSICLEDLKKIRDITVVDYALQGKSIILKFIYRLANSFIYRTKGRFFSRKLISLFYPFYIPRIIDNGKQLCFVFISDPWDLDYVKYLKNRYPNCKIVMALRDLVKTKWFYNELKEANVVDLWMSYDKEECIKYNMEYFTQFESAIKIPCNDSIPKSDVFFAGRAKNRLLKIVECYDYLTSLGLNCLFFIVDAPETQKVERIGVFYIEKPMSYRNIIEYTINSKCLLDINQDGATGFTSRFLEAIMYNKLLLTNTVDIEHHRLFNNKYIKVFSDINEINLSFFLQADSVKYDYNNEFSPIQFMEQLNSTIK